MCGIMASIKGTIGIVLIALTIQAQAPDGDWTTYNRTYSGERFSPLTEITTANVSGLRPICTYDTGETVGFQTGPFVVGSVMYFTTFQNTYAIDRCTRRRRTTTSGREPVHDRNCENRDWRSAYETLAYPQHTGKIVVY